MATDRKLLNKLSHTREIPTLPEVVHLALSKLDKSNSGAQDVADIIAEDVAMTAQVMRLSNSVLFNPTTRRISSAPLAVARIGFDEVRKMVITIGVVDLFRKHRRTPLNYKKFWRHCIATGILSEIVAEASPVARTTIGSDGSTYFPAGLLHDIGILILAGHFKSRYGSVLEACVNQGKSLADVEGKKLGVNHLEVGAGVIHKWKITESIAAAVAHNGAPESASETERTFVRVIHVADWVADSMGFGILDEKHSLPFSEGVWCKLALSQSDLPQIRADFEVALRDSKLFGTIDGG